MLRIVTKDDAIEKFNRAKKLFEETAGMVAICDYVDDFDVISKSQMKTDMRNFRTAKSTGADIEILEVNNVSRTDGDGLEWHHLVLHCGDNDQSLLALVFGRCVFGVTYIFQNIENRDKVYKYIMGV